jgi:YhcH/YjgK/YiaL family protein
MIVDTLKNASKYFSVHPLFAKAFAYISKLDMASVEVGKSEIEGDMLRAIISNKTGMTASESVAKFECHNKHIDIQLCIAGKESFGWKPREKCVLPNGGYNEEKDVQLYTDQPDTFFELTDGQFVIFFPEDVHAPMIGLGEIKKLVIKVKL